MHCITELCRTLEIAAKFTIRKTKITPHMLQQNFKAVPCLLCSLKYTKDYICSCAQVIKKYAVKTNICVCVFVCVCVCVCVRARVRVCIERGGKGGGGRVFILH
jgi:hypothetical protein